MGRTRSLKTARHPRRLRDEHATVYDKLKPLHASETRAAKTPRSRRPGSLDARPAAGRQGLRPGALGQMTVVVELSAVATAALRAVRDAIRHEPHRALTVGEPPTRSASTAGCSMRRLGSSMTLG
jgi:hypothetical protein